MKESLQIPERNAGKPQFKGVAAACYAGNQGMLRHMGMNGAVVKEPVLQFGRGKDLLGAEATNCIIKVNFAGSGYKAWIKRDNLQGKDQRGWEGQNPGIEDKDYETMYGEAVGGDDLVRKKAEGQEVTMYFPGPLAPFDSGALNRGKYNIQANVDRAFDMVQAEITRLQAAVHDSVIHIIIKGHSRGGVAAGLLYKRLKASPQDNISLHLIQYDPVPGPAHIGINDIDLGADTDPYGGKRVVVYSLNDGHGGLDHAIGAFTPQRVQNADIIIFTEDNHTSGLDDLAPPPQTAPQTEGAQAQPVQHKRGFGGLSGARVETLTEKVYLYKKDGTMMPITSVRQFVNLTQKGGDLAEYFSKKAYLIRGGRLDVLCQVLLSMFPDDHDGVEEIRTLSMTFRKIGSKAVTALEYGTTAVVDQVVGGAIETGKEMWEGTIGTAVEAWEGISRTAVEAMERDGVLDTAKWIGGKGWDGAKWTAGKAWDGTKWTAGKVLGAEALSAAGAVWDGAKWTAGKAWDGTKRTAGAIRDGAGKLVRMLPGSQQ